MGAEARKYEGDKDMTKAAEIPAYLETQLTVFFAEQFERCKARYRGQESQQEIQKYFEWAFEFSRMYLKSRLERADDLSTPEIEKAQELAREYIGKGNHDFFATCVDGRNMPTVMFTKVPHVGGVLRAPAGTVTGFMEGLKPGTVFIDMDSYVVQQIERLIKERPGQTIFYGLDSHLGCAARGLIHATEGGKQKDSGLRRDIESKMITARGILKLRENLVNKGEGAAEIIPTFFSFNPSDGFVTAALEANIDDPEVVKEGYTDRVLKKLAGEGRIVRTGDLINDSEIVTELNAVLEPKSADFRNTFPESVLQNWQAITKLYDHGKSKTYKKIHSQLTDAYLRSGWTVGESDNLDARIISAKTVKQKAKFLLKNLLTRFSIAGTDVDPEGQDPHAHGVHSAWPFNSHQESIPVITDGGYGPFSQLDAFSIFSRDLNSLLSNTKLTLDLIRGFRKQGNSKDPVSSKGLSKAEFESAPLPVSDKAIVRIDDENLWETLTSIDLSGLLTSIDWDSPKVLGWTEDSMKTSLLLSILDQGLQIDSETVNKFSSAVYELFDRTRIMMKDKPFRHMILNGNIILINTIVDSNRRPRMVLPLAI